MLLPQPVSEPAIVPTAQPGNRGLPLSADEGVPLCRAEQPASTGRLVIKSPVQQAAVKCQAALRNWSAQAQPDLLPPVLGQTKVIVDARYYRPAAPARGLQLTPASSPEASGLHPTMAVCNLPFPSTLLHPSVIMISSPTVLTDAAVPQPQLYSG